MAALDLMPPMIQHLRLSGLFLLSDLGPRTLNVSGPMWDRNSSTLEDGPGDWMRRLVESTVPGTLRHSPQSPRLKYEVGSHSTGENTEPLFD